MKNKLVSIVTSAALPFLAGCATSNYDSKPIQQISPSFMQSVTPQGEGKAENGWTVSKDYDINCKKVTFYHNTSDHVLNVVVKSGDRSITYSDYNIDGTVNRVQINNDLVERDVESYQLGDENEKNTPILREAQRQYGGYLVQADLANRRAEKERVTQAIRKLQNVTPDPF